ncbi:MAG: 1-acyl-sn-glycerol-3-phosphate acyltransferase [Betaproteobacteria bacterium]|nr:1-acyl-sn-glycerol-3-phosphate acyltransferase [Betaproteobacteria bacterium]
MSTATPAHHPPKNRPITPSLVRLIRWTRMLVHVGVGLFLVGLIFPRVVRDQRAAITKWWSAKILRILNITLTTQGVRPAARIKNTVIVANHVSWLDIFVLNAVHASRFIAKSEIRDWPVAGWLCDRAGTIFIRRARRSDTVRINQIMHEVLAGGDTIGLFPEGTTTAGDHLLKFNSSLFEPAIANTATILPVAVRYRHNDGEWCKEASFVGELSFGESLGLIIRQPSMIVEVAFTPPIDSANMSRRDLALRAEVAVAAALGVPQPHAHQRFSGIVTTHPPHRE